MSKRGPPLQISNDWLRMVLVLAMYSACFVFALAILYVPDQFDQKGELPLGSKILLSVAFLIFLLVSYVSAEAAWKTFLKLIGYVLILISVILTAIGLRVIIYHILGHATEMGVYAGAIAAGVGAMGMVGFSKVIDSTWLN